jgi:hypothetical protein
MFVNHIGIGLKVSTMVNAAQSDVIIPEYEKTQVCSRDFFVDVTKEPSGCLNKGATSWLLSTEAEFRRQKMLQKSATSKGLKH